MEARRKARISPQRTMRFMRKDYVETGLPVKQRVWAVRAMQFSNAIPMRAKARLGG